MSNRNIPTMNRETLDRIRARRDAGTYASQQTLAKSVQAKMNEAYAAVDTVTQTRWGPISDRNFIQPVGDSAQKLEDEIARLREVGDKYKEDLRSIEKGIDPYAPKPQGIPGQLKDWFIGKDSATGEYKTDALSNLGLRVPLDTVTAVGNIGIGAALAAKDWASARGNPSPSTRYTGTPEVGDELSNLWRGIGEGIARSAGFGTPAGHRSTGETDPWILIGMGPGSGLIKGATTVKISNMLNRFQPKSFYTTTLTGTMKGTTASVERSKPFKALAEVDAVPSLANADELLASVSTSNLGRLGNRLPGVAGKATRGVAQWLGGLAATQSSLGEKAWVVMVGGRADGAQKLQRSIAGLMVHGAERQVFPDVSKTGIMLSGKLKGLHLNTIRSDPSQYWKLLTTKQKAWIKAAGNIEKRQLKLLTDAGIDVHELVLPGTKVYAGRIAVARVDDVTGEIIEQAYIKGTGRSSGGFLKERIFDTMEDGIKAGFRYMSEEDMLFSNLNKSYRLVADKQAGDWLLHRIPFTTQAGPTAARDSLAALNHSIRRDIKVIDNIVNETKMTKRNRASYKRQYEHARESATKKAAKLEERLAPGVSMAVRTRKAFEAEVASIERLLREQYAIIKHNDNFLARANARDTKKAKVLKNAQDRLDARVALLKTEKPKWEKMYREAKREKWDELTAYKIPGFQGKKFKDDAADAVKILSEHMDTKDAHALLKAGAKLSAYGRVITLSGDASFIAIQLIFLAGSPNVMAKSIAAWGMALKNPRIHHELLVTNTKLLDKYHTVMIGGKYEMGEAITGTGGLLSTKGETILSGKSNVSGIVKVLTESTTGEIARAVNPLRVVGKVLAPFTRATEHALDVAGIDMLKSLDHLGTTAAKRVEIANYVNHIRGLTNTSRVGITPTTQAFESIAALAPRYNRSIAMLLTDLHRGNITGQMARKQMAKGVAAIMSASYAFSLMLGKSPEEAAIHLSPVKWVNGEMQSNSDFLTWDVYGQRIGPGSKVRSVMVLLARSLSNPEDLLDISMRNPAFKFARGNFGIIPSMTTSMLSGRSYVGEDVGTRNGFDLGKLLGHTASSYLVPIWLQSVAFEGGSVSQRSLRGASDFIGFRAYEKLPMQTFIEGFERKSGVNYEDDESWGAIQAYKRSPEGQFLWEAVQVHNIGHGRLTDYLLEIRNSRTKRNTGLTDLDKRLQAGAINHKEFADGIKDVSRTFGSAMQTLRTVEAYADTIEELEDPDNKSPDAINQSRYYGILFDPEYDDPALGRDYHSLDAALLALQQDLGTDVYNRMLRQVENNKTDMPESVQDYYKDMVALRAYWEITDKHIQPDTIFRDWHNEYQRLQPFPDERRAYLRLHPDLDNAVTTIANDREMMRLKNPIIDAILVKWYGYSPTGSNIRHGSSRATIQWLDNED